MNPLSAETERCSIQQFTETAYLDYAMAVVLDRALPHIADGLKPVQRRIVYAMSELGLKSESKPKKSARTVGDVLGKYHPHGDAACYEAMVLMAQPFSYRYPLIEGQGNWGSLDDPKSFAAMRYTEARLSRYASSLLGELDQGTVEWTSNFDGTLEEPRLLPAQLPNLLLNGTSGIAVGMATDFPPHALEEIVQALLHLLDHPGASVAELMQWIQGPDFATGGELVTPKFELMKHYETGQGSVKLRAVYEKTEEGAVAILELPFQTATSTIMTQVAALLQAKKLPWLADLRDESDEKNPVRLVLLPRSQRHTEWETWMEQLFLLTDLEKTVRINLNAIDLEGRPGVKPLNAWLSEWLQARMHTVKRRLQHRLSRVEERLHLLAGLHCVYLNLDAVLKIIREEEEPKVILMQRFSLSPFQAEAILELRLRQLARLEEIAIQKESHTLVSEAEMLKGTLEQPARLKQLVKKELKQAVEQHGNGRRTRCVERVALPKVKQDTWVRKSVSEPVTVILSKAGWIRAGKGHELDPLQLSYKTGDACLQFARALSTDWILLLDAKGRAFGMMAEGLPSARSTGEPLSARLNVDPEAPLIGFLSADPTSSKAVVLLQNQGFGFFTSFSKTMARQKNGKVLLKVPPAAKALAPFLIETDEKMALVTNLGRLLLISPTDGPVLERGKGSRLIRLSTEEHLVAALAVQAHTILEISAGAKKHRVPVEPFWTLSTRSGQKPWSPRWPLKQIESVRISD